MARTRLFAIIFKVVALAHIINATVGEIAAKAIEMEISGRRQANTESPKFPLDFYDSSVRSPKSVKFSDSGEFVFVNALEGMKTLIYNKFGTQKIGEIVHEFDQNSEDLFELFPNFGYQKPSSKSLSARFNIFGGKPVEMEISHQGKYLWLPYYRRDFDTNGTLPSAVAIVNTQTKKIERVMSAGPIPKNIRLSHGGGLMAVTHWGDNTIGLFDVRASEASNFRALSLLVDEKRLSVDHLGNVNRDELCGFCVRGLAFSVDDRFLFVGRMAEDGISVFDVSNPSQARYIGTLHGIGRRPRDLEATNGALIVSFNGSGEIAQIPIQWLVTQILLGVTYLPPDKVKNVFVGKGLRSIEVTEDGVYVFVAVNSSSEIVAVNLKEGRVEKRLHVDSFPVGLGLSPDEHQLWVTAQGHYGVGGNSVTILQIRRPEKELIR